VAFPGWTGRARIAGTVRTTTPAGWLDLALNGAPVQRVEFASAVVHDFEVLLPCQPGGNIVELRCPPGPAATLDFSRLTVDDGAGAPGP
jgi:hypothetical protein